jgi:hypothetical protein
MIAQASGGGSAVTRGNGAEFGGNVGRGVHDGHRIAEREPIMADPVQTVIQPSLTSHHWISILASGRHFSVSY